MKIENRMQLHLWREECKEKRQKETCRVLMCEEESECISQKLNCRHKHDDECGYSPATRGTPCEFDCEICDVEDDMKMATPSNAKAVTVASVQAMIDALPDVEEVRKDNAEEVKAQLEAIDDAKAELSDEEIDKLDFSRYMEVAAVLEQLLYGVATRLMLLCWRIMTALPSSLVQVGSVDRQKKRKRARAAIMSPTATFISV